MVGDDYLVSFFTENEFHARYTCTRSPASLLARALILNDSDICDNDDETITAPQHKPRWATKRSMNVYEHCECVRCGLYNLRSSLPTNLILDIVIPPHLTVAHPIAFSFFFCIRSTSISSYNDFFFFLAFAL